MAASIICAAGPAVPSAAQLEKDRIKPWTENPAYWQYEGEPVLLIGGSGEDNLFNHPDSLYPEGLESHLDLLVASGGNYVRNTMSSRDDGNLFAFSQDEETGLYDLDRFNDAYWQRFERFLQLTQSREIIVQIEFFDRFDYYGKQWESSPFNPKNNVNYGPEESGLEEAYDYHPSSNNNPFFHSPPELMDLPLVRAYQETYLAKLLEISFSYGNVLYCISNETGAEEEWSRHWARFVRRKAEAAGVGVDVTEMWGHINLNHHLHRRTFDYPELYSFVDISQNNHLPGDDHWNQIILTRETLVADPVRPVNNVKIYGGVVHGGGPIKGTNRLWRIVFAGCASARFHRPGPDRDFKYGVGLSDLGQTHLRSMRQFLARFNIFASQPANDLLSDRTPGEAYCAVVPGKQVALFFPDGGDVRLDLGTFPGEWELHWLDIMGEEWTAGEPLSGGRLVTATTPGPGQWVALLLPLEK